MDNTTRVEWFEGFEVRDGVWFWGWGETAQRDDGFDTTFFDDGRYRVCKHDGSMAEKIDADGNVIERFCFDDRHAGLDK